MLEQLELSPENFKSLHGKLKDYRYCTDLSDLQSGNYLQTQKILLMK